MKLSLHHSLLILLIMLATPLSLMAQAANLMEVASSNPEFATFVTALGTTDLPVTLTGETPYTLFIPTNEAFQEMLVAMEMPTEALMGNSELLADVLSYHVVQGNYLVADLQNGMTLTTLEGQEVTLTVAQDGVLVNTAEIVEADLLASNGVVHVINGVLLPEISLPPIDPLSITGDIIVAGSSTVYPLTQQLAERFSEEGYTGNISVDSIGTGGGFERFCVSVETDIANASRPIEEDEIQACEANGRAPLEFRVGTDALAVVVSTDNEFLEDLTIEQLGLIYSGTLTTWNQIDSSFPSEPILLFSPGTDSGTFDYFVEAVMQPYAEAQGVTDNVTEAAETAMLEAPGLQFSENDNVLVEGVQASPYAIGFFGYAYYLENDEVVRILSIDGVTPTAITAENGEYPLARPLFIYSAAAVLAEKPQVGEFISFYLTYVNEEITEVGYFPASTIALNRAKTLLMEAVSGTTE